MIEPLLIEAIVLGLVGSILFIRQRGRPVAAELPTTFLEGVSALQEGDLVRAFERLEPEGPAEFESLRIGWLALAQQRAGRRDQALRLWRQSGVATPEWVLRELDEAQPGSLAADQVVALARQLPTSSARAMEARVRVFEREGRDGDLWSSVLRAQSPLGPGTVARAAVRALSQGLRVSKSDLERFEVPRSAIERAQLMREFERHGAVRRPLEDTAALLAEAREQTCADVVVHSGVDLDALWRDLHGLAASASPSTEKRSVDDGPSLAIRTLADSPTEQFFETLRSWSGGALQGPLARNIARAARLRGPRLLDEIANAPAGVLRLDRIRLCVLHFVIRTNETTPRSLEDLRLGFARIEVGEAFFVLPFEFASPVLRSLDAELWRVLRGHPRPDAGFLFECLDVPELAPRALEWLRERPDLVAEHVCVGLRDEARRAVVRRHMHRLPDVAASALLRAMAAESQPITEWVHAFLELGGATIDALLDCAGSPPLEALADWLGRRLPASVRSDIEVRIGEASNESEREFLRSLQTKAGSQSIGGDA